MTERRYQAQVGALFLASIVVLTLGILWFKEFSVSQTSRPVRADFPNASGLLKGDAVEVKGVPSGKVTAIEFVEGQARVTLALSGDVTLHEGAHAAIEDVSLMGQKAVNVHPGDPSRPVLPPDHILPGVYRGGVTDLLSGVGGTLATFDRLANRLDTLLVAFDADRQGQMGRTFDHLEQATGDLASLLSENREDLSVAITSMSAAMTELQAMMDGRGAQFGEAMEQAATTASRLDSTLTTLDQTVRRVDGILARVESGEGTLGHLVQEDALYEELVRTLRDAKELLVDVRENPKRYFKFSVF